MIGGVVIETVTLPEKVWINCEEEQSTSKCAIYVENTPKARAIGVGDIVWWQGERAYWTAKDSKGKNIGKGDIVLKRIGFSGVKRPCTCIT